MTWWRRQRVPLIALIVAAVAVVGVQFWLAVAPALSRTSQSIEMVETDADIAGQTLRMGSARWDEFEAPSGSRTLSIRLDSGGGADASTCGPFVLTEPSSERSWQEATSVLDVPYDAGERSCVEESAPYRILTVFLVPDDASGPFFFDVPGPDQVTARFVIEP